MTSWRIGFLSIAARWWVVFVLAAAVGGLLAYVLGSRESPTYEAEANLLVIAPEPEVGALQTAAALAPTYAELVRTAPVLRRTVEGLHGRVTYDELRDSVRGESSRDTHLLTVRVRSRDPAVAVLAANELARQLVRVVSARSARAEGDRTARTRLEIVDPATDADKVRPRGLLLAWLGALTGLFVALAVAIFVDSRRRTVRAEDDLEELTAGAVFGSVDGAPRSSGGADLVGGSSTTEGTTSYRRLAERIGAAAEEEAPRSVLVIGAEQGTGSGTVAANLAATWADTGSGVVLADLADTPEAVRLFGTSAQGAGAEPARHVGSLSRGGVVLDCFEVRSGRAPLLVLPRSEAPSVLDGPQARELVELLLGRAALVVVHCGPPARSPRSLSLAQAADVTILVVRRGRTDRASVTSTLESLEQARAGIVGTVFNTSRRGA
jgi:capsular polysaccharide biosynthesis protein/Mrp family chromosome partitioning ATPase